MLLLYCGLLHFISFYLKCSIEHISYNKSNKKVSSVLTLKASTGKLHTTKFGWGINN